MKSGACELEYHKSATIAREAIQHLERQEIPLTPENFAVWYRFVENQIPQLRCDIAHSLLKNGKISTLEMNQYQQMLKETDDANEENKLTSSLKAEMENLQKTVSQQLSANSEFGASIEGAKANLAKNVTAETIAATIASLVSSNEAITRQLKETRRQLNASHNQVDGLRSSLVKAQRVSMTDSLTSVGNRRFCDYMINKAIENMDFQPNQYLILIDLDDFKTINDTYGHNVGDKALMFLATQLKNLAKDANVARYGGDEFALVHYDTEECALLDLTKQIQQFFQDHVVVLGNTGKELSLSISIGGSYLNSSDNTTSWFERTDRSLYRAKSDGKNCVRVADGGINV